jgi:hypothetical protein
MWTRTGVAERVGALDPDLADGAGAVGVFDAGAALAPAGWTADAWPGAGVPVEGVPSLTVLHALSTAAAATATARP